MTDPILRFLPNEAGEKEGLGDAGIETFRDTPYASCAREAGQNSRDAAKELPVRITFDIRRLGHDEFPSYAELREAIEACRAEASQDRETAFFDNAADVIGKARIPVLEIADSNTTGLIGPPDVHGTPFHSLVKASGVTVKSDADRRGIVRHRQERILCGLGPADRLLFIRLRGSGVRERGVCRPGKGQACLPYRY